MYKNPRAIELQISRSLKFWRMFNGMTQESVAFALGIARQHYCRMENAHTCPSLNTFVALAHALDISPYMLALTMEALD